MPKKDCHNSYIRRETETAEQHFPLFGLLIVVRFLSKAQKSQPLAISDICLSHGGCQKIIAVSVKLQIILHNAVLITMKAMAVFEFYCLFFFFFLPVFVAMLSWRAQHGSLTKAVFYTQICMAGSMSLVHCSFAAQQKGSAGTLGQVDDPTAQHPCGKPLWTPTCVPFSSSIIWLSCDGGSDFHLPFKSEEGKHKSLKSVACVHNASGKNGFCTWISGVTRNDIPSHLPRHLSSASSSTNTIMLPWNWAQLIFTTTTLSIYPEYFYVVMAMLPAKPKLYCLRWAQVKPWPVLWCEGWWNEGCLGRYYFVMSNYPKGILCWERRMFCSHDKSWHLILLDVKEKKIIINISLCYRMRDCLSQGCCCGESTGLKK